MLDKYGDGIGELWIHKPGFGVEDALISFGEKDQQKLLLELAKSEGLDEEFNIVMKSIGELKEVIDKARELKTIVQGAFLKRYQL